MKKLKFLLQYKYILLTIIIILVSIIRINIEHKSKYDINTKRIYGYINNLIVDGDKLSIEIIGKEKIIGAYYFKNILEKNHFDNIYKLGDYIFIEGELKTPKNETVFNLFSYKEYLLQNGIHYLINIEKIKKIKNNNKLIYKIKQSIIDKINTINRSKNYLHAFILGEDSYLYSYAKESYKINGISHLFAISGSNIALLVTILLLLIKRIKLKYLIVFIFIYGYMFITNFCPSIVRAGIFFILLSLNKTFKLKIKTINVLLLTLLISLLFNPFLILDVGFEFSFIISLYLILYQPLIIQYKSKLWNLFIVSLISFLSSLPIVLNNFYQINILSIILNILFVPFVSIIVFPLSLICFILPFLDNILFFLIKIMEDLSIFFSKIDLFVFIIGKPSLIMILVYYIVITYVLNSFINKKYLNVLLIPMLVIVNHIIIVCNSSPEIIFIDVGQGDSTLIRLPNNKGNILVDTGGVQEYSKESWQKRNNAFSLGEDVIIQYLKSIGINHLDYLIITHGDYDHMGEAINIINNIKANNIIMNSFDINFNEKELIKASEYKKINYCFVKEGDKINIDNYSFYVLNPYINLNENDNSIVLYFTLNNKKILLTGDASSKVEEHLIDKYNLNIDILKVGHHGSKTSTSKNFVDNIRPIYSIISVGQNNKFGHPHDITMKILQEYSVKTYLTSINGSIKMIFKKNNVTIFTTGT